MQTPDQLQQRSDSFLDCQKDLALMVKRGDQDIAAGRLLEHDEVVTSIEKLLQNQKPRT